MMTGPVLIIADDLTGANDAGAQCVRAGLRVQVACAATAVPPTPPQGVDAIVVDTESRHDTPDVAAGKVRDAVKAAAGWQGAVRSVDHQVGGVRSRQSRRDSGDICAPRA